MNNYIDASFILSDIPFFLLPFFDHLYRYIEIEEE
jgi:hypothetical protein